MSTDCLVSRKGTDERIEIHDSILTTSHHCYSVRSIDQLTALHLLVGDFCAKFLFSICAKFSFSIYVIGHANFILNYLYHHRHKHNHKKQHN